MVDTPGFGDSNGQDSKLIDDMITNMKKDIKSTNVFLLLFNGLNDRIDGMLHQMLRDLRIMFGDEMWNHVILGFTNWGYDASSISERERRYVNSNESKLFFIKCTQLSKIFCRSRNEEWKLRETNRVLQEKHGITQTLDGVFLDPFAVTSPDHNVQGAFYKQISKLWSFISQKDAFEFKSMQDILDDLHQCQYKTSDDIKELKERTKQLVGKLQPNLVAPQKGKF